MIKFLIFLLKVILFVVVAVWVADRAGRVSFEWQDHVIETSAALAIGLIVLMMWASYKAARFISILHTTPRIYRMHARLRQQRQGHKMLSEAVNAIAEQKKGKSLLFLRRAEKLLGPSQVVDLVKSHLGNDAKISAPAINISAEVNSPFAWRQVVEHHLHEHRLGEALQAAKMFAEKHPALPLAKKMLFDVHVRSRNWDAAMGTLEEMRLQHAMPRKDWRVVKAAVLAERARESLEHGHPVDAFDMAMQADRMHPNWVPAISMAARALAKQDKAKEASNLIERMWGTAAHEQLGDLYLALRTGKSDLQKAQAAEKLAKNSIANPASRLFVARALTKAGLWGQARSYAKALADEHPRKDYYELLAHIEDIQNHDPATAQEWRKLASSAPPDEAWVCGNCKQPHAEWQGLCQSCKGFNTLAWGVPLHKQVMKKDPV